MENSSGIGSCLWASDVGMPCEEIAFERSGSNPNSRDFLVLNLFKVFHQPLVGESLQFFVDHCPVQCSIDVSAWFSH